MTTTPYQEFYPEIVAGYTRFVTIATDNVFTLNDFRQYQW
jgi:hypothetical protein